MSDGPISEGTFERVADETLKKLDLAFNALDLDLEADLESGILTVEFADGTQYIINSHRAARQIWMAAERTAWHFDYTADASWVAPKTGDELWAAIEAVVSKKAGKTVSLR